MGGAGAAEPALTASWLCTAAAPVSATGAAPTELNRNQTVNPQHTRTATISRRARRVKNRSILAGILRLLAAKKKLPTIRLSCAEIVGTLPVAPSSTLGVAMACTQNNSAVDRSA